MKIKALKGPKRYFKGSKGSSFKMKAFKGFKGSLGGLSFGVFFHEIKCNRITSFMEFMKNDIRERSKEGKTEVTAKCQGQCLHDL